MEPRTEEDAVNRVLHITIDGRVQTLRTIKARHSIAWKEHAFAILDRIDLTKVRDGEAFMAALSRLPTDIMLDLIVEFDRKHVLGGGATDDEEREWLLDNADDQDLYGAVTAMWLSCLPFSSGVRSVVEAFGPQIRALIWQFVAAMDLRPLTRSLLANLPSSPLPSGDSTQTPSSGSPTSSSSSTGPTDRSDEATSAPSTSTPQPMRSRGATRTHGSRRASGSARGRGASATASPVPLHAGA